MTPRKAEVPREKPCDWRRTAMMSSSRLMLSMHSVRSAYLRTTSQCWGKGSLGYAQKIVGTGACD